MQHGAEIGHYAEKLAIIRAKFSKFGQSIQLHSRVSEVVSIFQAEQNNNQTNGKIMAKTAK